MKPYILKFIILFLIFTRCFSFCAEKGEQEKISFIQIGKGNLYGDGREGIPKQDIMIATQEEWENLKTAMNSSQSFNEIEIDFNKYLIIAVFDKIRDSGGCEIDISKITNFSDKIVVTVNTNCSMTAPTIMTQPYHIVKILKTIKRIEFEHINN